MLLIVSVVVIGSILSDPDNVADDSAPSISEYGVEPSTPTPVPAVWDGMLAELAALANDLATVTPAPTPTPQPVTPSPSAAPVQQPATPAPVPPAPPVREPAGQQGQPVALPTPAPTPPPPPGFANDGLAGQLLGLINSARSAAGVSALNPHGSLIAAAKDYAAFHFLNADPFQLSHNLNGTPKDRMMYYGYTGGGAETLAVGPVDAHTLMDVWMNSPPHRDIILNGAFVDVGVGCYQGPYSDNSGNAFEIALCVADFGQP